MDPAGPLEVKIGQEDNEKNEKSKLLAEISHSHGGEEERSMTLAFWIPAV